MTQQRPDTSLDAVEHLAAALERTDSADARFHIRQAMQLVVAENSVEDGAAGESEAGNR